MTHDTNRRYSVEKHPDVGGDPIPTDEPCIVIRGQDRLALSVLDFYLAMYRTYPGFDPRVVVELESHREDLILWQIDNPPKLADR